MVQSLVSPLSNRMILSQAAKGNDETGLVGSINAGETVAMAGRVFTTSMGLQWRTGNSFRNRNGLFNSQGSSISAQAGLGLGVQAPGLNAVTSASLNISGRILSNQQSSQQALRSGGQEDTDVSHLKAG